MALAKALEERGHAVTIFNLADTARTIKERGLHFVPFGLAEYPEGALAQSFEKISKLRGPAALAYFVERMILLSATAFAQLPQLIEREKMEALVIDQLFPGGATLAQHLRLPYASVANALAVNSEPGVPPPNFPWPFDPAPAAEVRNEKGWQQLGQMFAPWKEAENAQRAAWGLPPYNDLLQDGLSPIAQIAQQPQSFDFPRTQLPPVFEYVGPLNHPATRAKVPFPWDQLTGVPLVYASMGTLQNGLDWVFRTILEACATLDVQLVLSLGGSSLALSELGPLPENALAVSYAPQVELLAGASLCITHAGLNTALDALAHGVPMVAIPVTNDQPGVAARIQWSGVGETIALDQLTTAALRDMVSKVLATPDYRERAAAIQCSIPDAPLTRACQVLEQRLNISPALRAAL